MADDALATRPQAAQEMGARALQSDAKRRLKEEGGGGDSAATGGGFVANLYWSGQSGDAWFNLPSGRGVNACGQRSFKKHNEQTTI